MMPAQGRPAAPSLPPVNDEATIPFSDLFNNGFDRATIDATAQLADRSIFVASNGRRYRIESIDPDPYPVLPSVASVSSPASAQPVPVSLQASPSPPTAGRTAPVPVLQLRAPDNPPADWKRSPSNGSAHSYSPGGVSIRSGQSISNLGGGIGALPGAVPHVPTDEISAMMAHLSINRRFGAAALYGLSDGGVQAAETLTDPDLGPRSPIITTSPASPIATSPRISSSYPQQHQQQQQQQQQQHPTSPYPSSPRIPYDPPPAAPPPQHHQQPHQHHWIPVNYANYTAQTIAHLQQSRQMAVTATGLPSLLEGATAMTPPPEQQLQHRASDPFAATWSLVPDDKEVCVDGQGQGHSANGYGYGTGGYGYGTGEYGNGYLASPTTPTGTGTMGTHLSVSAPPSVLGRQASFLSRDGRASGGSGGSGSGDIDTLKQVVVRHPPAPSCSSDGASTGRDNVLPGEDLLFDGPVKSAQSLTSPVFRHGVLKVFRNTLNNDLRFHCRVERESETYWMKASNAQLVPAYAYDQRLSHVVYIRDRESDKGSGYMGASQGNGRPSGIYQFSTLKELFDFQAKLTGEKVVLDIGSVRMVTVSKANSRSSTSFSSARLQIWHEVEGRRTAHSDVASFVTAGTTLSGPLRERLVASSSRLMLYLGRSGEYITCFITDDLEIKAEGQTLVKIKPRKGVIPFSRKGSRWPWVKAHLQTNQGTESAGFDIHGKAVEVDVGSDYDSYKTFEIDFENSPSQDNFIRKWDEVMRERRLQRMKLNRIQEDMESAVFTGRQARGVFT